MTTAWSKEGDMETDRITKLESWAQFTDSRLATIEKKLDALITLTTEIQLSLARKKDCPDPGACLLLQPRVTNIETRLTTIESAGERSKGAIAVGKALWFALGGVVTGVVLHYVTKHP